MLLQKTLLLVANSRETNCSESHDFDLSNVIYTRLTINCGYDISLKIDIRPLKCFNCDSEFLPTLSKPICQECGFCYYCRDFFSCVHYDAYNKDYNYEQEQQQEPLQSQSQWKNKKKNDVQKNWDSYTDLVSSTTAPDLENITAVIVIDESLRRKLGKFHILELIQKLTSTEMNCYVDIIPTGTSDNDVIKVFNFYIDIPALLLTSDKGLYERLPAHSLFVKSKKGSNAVRIITQAVKHRISRL